MKGENLALLILRVMLAVTFLYHGVPKLFGGISRFSEMLGGMGLFAPEFFAWVVAIVEAGGGLLLLFGLWVRLVSIPLVVNMLAAIYLVHFKNGFDFGKGGYEANLWVIAMLLALVLQGPGNYSLQAVLKKKPAS